MSRFAPRLMLVTDGARCALPLERLAASAARGGVDLIQVREPDLSDGALVALVRRVVDAVAAWGTRVVVNERFDVALAAGAHGVHLKSNGLDPTAVRESLGRLAVDPFLIGLSTHGADELAAASAAGAVDYCCVGPLHATGAGKAPLEAEGLKALLCEARRLGPLAPYLVLGGVACDDIALISALAAPGERWGVAAIRPFAGASDESAAEQAARSFAEALDAAPCRDRLR